ncbi:hypothetical protein GIB67_009529 [Kingdonia uniflora]|uniref:X8 domain-containing protein n=1 Tax=Kingdonia uniflora TaxID=39325 RepID=A0A7J7NWW3_9MAGN|nr:hypothetical protein GIB67_009529 [Kingdonia uniflora]
MKILEEIAQVPLSISPISSNFTEQVVNFNPRSSSSSTWLANCHGLGYKVSLILPSALFVVYLAYQARKSLAKLSNGRSYIIIAYYGLLWLVSLLNLVWCALQVWECTAGKESAWNLLSLFTSSGMMFLEISLVAFLLQGSYSSGLEALTRTFVVSGIVVGVDILLKAIYVFGFGIPLFIDNDETTNRLKWGLWVVHKLLLTGVYGFILFMHHSKWRERLPDAATWCICRSDVSDASLQKSLDYACGAGADCSAINQNGNCYQPNTVRAHCSYAVNSYFQKKSQAQQACVFSNTATIVSADPSVGSCSFTASASPTGNTTTPGTSTTPSTTTPGTSTTPGTFTPSPFGLGPSTGIDSSDAHKLANKVTNLFSAATIITLCVSFILA